MGVLCAWRRSSRKTHPWRSGHLHIFKVSHFGRLVALAMGVPDHWLKKGRGKGKPRLKGKRKDKKGRKDKGRGNKNVSSLSEFLVMKDQVNVPVQSVRFAQDALTLTWD